MKEETKVKEGQTVKRDGRKEEKDDGEIEKRGRTDDRREEKRGWRRLRRR